MLFEDIELEENKDKKLSISEKVIIAALMGVARIGLFKLKRAKTYGDVMKIANLIEDRSDNFSANTTEENVQSHAKEIEKLEKEVEGL